MNAYYNTAEDLGVTVAYEAQVTHVVIEGGRFTGLDVEHLGGDASAIEGRALVLASGGFQADLDWLAAPGARRRATS